MSIDHPDIPQPWAVVEAPSGTFHTVREHDVIRAWGIRYAESERFGAPHPYTYGTTPFLADTRAPACPQRHGSSDIEHIALGFDEHCQRLSITRPATNADHLPVMVWIHGGSYTGGAGDLPYYDPRVLVEEQDIIVVNVTYRLGLFGYLGDGTKRATNPGLMDQIEAIHWVHHNIEAFGGNPKLLTIAGQSAGAHACWDLLLVTELQGIVSRAILQSAPLGIVHGRGSTWDLLSPSPNMTEKLRKLPADDIAEMETEINKLALKHRRARFMPFSSRYVPPLPPEEHLVDRWRQLSGKVEVLMGTTSREIALFTRSTGLTQKLADNRWSNLLIIEPLIHALSWGIYGRDTHRWARILRRAGGNVGLYSFFFGRRGRSLTASHMAELPLLFPHNAWETGPDEIGAGVTGPQLFDTFDPARRDEVGRSIRAIWGTFVRSGFTEMPEVGIKGALRIRR